jgi:hypothetical protein
MNLRKQIAQSGSHKIKKMRLETALKAQSRRIFCALFFSEAILQHPLLPGETRFAFSIAPNPLFGVKWDICR